MRMLSVTLLLCAGMALTAAAGPKRLARYANNCPWGWMRWRTNCYRFEVSPTAWGDAEKRCLNQGGNLASIHSKEEHSTLQRLIRHYTHNSHTVTWVGGSDAQEGVWLWSDGSPMRFTDWNKNQPDNHRGNQNCMILNWGGLDGQRNWDDIGCTERFPSICKK